MEPISDLLVHASKQLVKTIALAPSGCEFEALQNIRLHYKNDFEVKAGRQ